MCDYVIQEIKTERLRQVEKEGYPTAHDDEHGDGSLADAAAHYAATSHPLFDAGWGKVKSIFPWARMYDKKNKKTRREQLVIAAALIVAEIERLDRLNAQPQPDEPAS